MMRVITVQTGRITTTAVRIRRRENESVSVQ